MTCSHSYASRALALGESLTMIGKLLGHTQVQTTARYAHLAQRLDPERRGADHRKHRWELVIQPRRWTSDWALSRHNLCPSRQITHPSLLPQTWSRTATLTVIR